MAHDFVSGCSLNSDSEGFLLGVLLAVLQAFDLGEGNISHV
jgi:hypothetical protein